MLYDLGGKPLLTKDNPENYELWWEALKQHYTGVVNTLLRERLRLDEAMKSANRQEKKSLRKGHDVLTERIGVLKKVLSDMIGLQNGKLKVEMDGGAKS